MYQCNKTSQKLIDYGDIAIENNPNWSWMLDLHTEY